MESVLSAKAMILRFIEKCIVDPTFAPVHLTAKLPAVDAVRVQTDIVRAGESLWDGKTYHSRMAGHLDTYPTIDLSKFPWKDPKDASFAAVRNGKLRAEMQAQLDEALASLPFQMFPSDTRHTGWRDVFAGEFRLDQYFYFELFRSDVPDWIIGLDRIHMSGSWELFLPKPSPEITLVYEIIAHNRLAGELARLETTPLTPIEEKRDEVRKLRERIEESLRQTAA